MTVTAKPAPVLDQQVSLAELSRRIAAELAASALVCRKTEDLAVALAAEREAPMRQLAPLQALDELTQRLTNLADVLEAIADRAPTDWSMEVAPLLQKVRLGDLARRLSGLPAIPAAPGEAEFF